MRITRRQLGRIIKEELNRTRRRRSGRRRWGRGKRRINENIPHTIALDYLKVISRETLEQLAPQAVTAMQDVGTEAPGEEDLTGGIWFMDKKPKLLVPGDEEEWSETNEPELAEWIAREWDNFAVDDGVVVFAGTLDDEYGWVWDNSAQAWHNYAY